MDSATLSNVSGKLTDYDEIKLNDKDPESLALRNFKKILEDLPPQFKGKFYRETQDKPNEHSDLAIVGTLDRLLQFVREQDFKIWQYCGLVVAGDFFLNYQLLLSAHRKKKDAGGKHVLYMRQGRTIANP